MWQVRVNEGWDFGAPSGCNGNGRSSSCRIQPQDQGGQQLQQGRWQARQWLAADIWQPLTPSSGRQPL